MGRRWDIPLRVLAALHYLALSEGIDPWSLPHDVLVERRDWVTQFVADQEVQTNEVGRCVALLPAFLELARLSGRRTDLLELGPGNEDDVRALLCFVWADQWRRIGRLKHAVEVARRDPPELIRGDYVEELPRVLADRDPDALTVVFQTASAQYLPRERYDDLRATLRDAAEHAPLGWISTQRHDEEVGEFTGYALEVALWPEHDARVVAFMGYHGEWLDYVA